jgi:DNA polymerase-3 subunit alpha
MEPILRETYGVIIYQEQVMEIARQVAGYTLGGADLLRRAMGKKNAKEMDAQRASFVEGAVKKGKDGKKAAELFDLIEKFAGYGFNKSHAAAYAALAVQTAFLKAVYPTEFFTAFLTIEKEDTEKLARYIQDARARGMKILAPDVNESESDFAIVEEGIIRFGLSAIKNVGESGVEAILAARKQGAGFKDIFDFLSRVDISRLNSRMVESLIKAGAFDALAKNQSVSSYRAKLLHNLEKLMEWAAKNLEQKESGQFSLFGDAGSTSSSALAQPHLEEASNPPSSRQMLDWEKELMGIYVSGSPLDKYLDRARQIGATPIYELADKKAESEVTIAALVSECREVRVKKGRRAGEMMAILKLEDASGQVEMVSFPDHYKEFSVLLKSNSPLVIRAQLEFEEEKPKLMCGDIQIGGHLAVEDLTGVEEKWPRKVKVDLNLSRFEGVISPEHLFGEMAKLLKKYPGTVPVEIHLLKGGSFMTVMELGADFNVHPASELIKELANMIAIPGGLRVEALH